MIRAAQRLAALLVVALLAWNATGVACALEREAVVHCCCGDHAASHRCACLSCPGVGKLRLIGKRAAAAPVAPWKTLRACGGRQADAISAEAVFVAPPPAAAVSPPAVAPLCYAAAATRLNDRLAESVRPPP